jgi:hypothetical protein
VFFNTAAILRFPLSKHLGFLPSALRFPLDLATAVDIVHHLSFHNPPIPAAFVFSQDRPAFGFDRRATPFEPQRSPPEAGRLPVALLYRRTSRTSVAICWLFLGAELSSGIPLSWTLEVCVASTPA